MKYVKQFVIIIAISFIGEFLKYVLPLPVPASIYGMVLMFAALLTGVLKLDDVKDTAKFLIEIMPLMFIPAGVGLMVSWNTLRPLLIPVAIITIVTIITVMIVSGHTAQFVLKRQEKGGKKDAKSAD
ncbi:MAG: CidA/LrgA family protein [Lachnospiraceae bacterium]